MRTYFRNQHIFARIGAVSIVMILMLAGFAVVTGSTVYAEPSINGTQQRVVQVDLVTHAKVSQYLDIDSSITGYGKNACGLVAAAAAVGSTEWKQIVDLIAIEAGSDYHKDTGIQPEAYVTAMEKVFGSENVTELDATNLDVLYQELQAGNIVIVDVKVNETKQVPSAATPNYAHFARVLGMDKNLEQVYIENTLRGDAYWTISFDDFNAAWEYPETTSSLIPDPANAEPVTNWAVVLDKSLLTQDFLNDL